jgi:hypothetical protein
LKVIVYPGGVVSSAFHEISLPNPESWTLIHDFGIETSNLTGSTDNKQGNLQNKDI